MRIAACHGDTLNLQLSMQLPESWVILTVEPNPASGNRPVDLVLDENHTAALAKALEAAVMEIQARAVQR